MKIALVVFGLLALSLVLVLLYGRSRWQGGTRQLRTAILAGQMKAEPAHYDSRERGEGGEGGETKRKKQVP